MTFFVLAQLAAPTSAQSRRGVEAPFLGDQTYVAGPGQCAKLRGTVPTEPDDEARHDVLTAKGYRGLRYYCDFERITPERRANRWTVRLRCYEEQDSTRRTERWHLRKDGSLLVRVKNRNVVFTVCPGPKAK